MSTTPTTPPTLPIDVFGVGRAPILVTGATGDLGRAVIAELERSLVTTRAFVHHTPLSTSPESRVTSYEGDIATGAGLDAALDGVGAVIHCAGNPKDAARVDVAGTENLLDAVTAWAPQAHIVHVSIVGCWENPYGYYRAKADTENAVEGFDGRTSIVRATQFHPFARRFVSGRAAHLTGSLGRISVAPVDPAWVASKLVDVALMRTHLVEPMELAGTETFTLAELATLTAHLVSRQARPALPVPIMGGALTAFARGTQLPGPDVERGGSTYAQWMAGAQTSGAHQAEHAARHAATPQAMRSV